MAKRKKEEPPKRGPGRPRTRPPRENGRVVLYVDLPGELKAAVEASAKENWRTISAHVEAILTGAMQAEGKLK